MKRYTLLVLFLLIGSAIQAQSTPKAERFVLITLDGLRWQEVFGGLDTALVNDREFNQNDSAGLMAKYYAETPQERRKKLMPFLWETIAAEGRIYGNRMLGNKVDNSNPHWFSYPGYSEILCGFVDTSINTNSYPNNPHINVLEFIHQQKEYKGSIAAFGAWDAFDRILNEPRAGFPVVSGRDNFGGAAPTVREQLLNDMKRDAYSPFGDAEQLDVFTHYAALEYLKNNRPKVLYIAYGETDEWAHHGHYKDYLDAAFQTDKWIGEIWNWVQNDPEYKGKTALLITTDHGRGDIIKKEWTSHGAEIQDSHEIWVAAVGPGLTHGGEMSDSVQLYQKQVAQTVAQWLGFDFKADHVVAPGLWVNSGK